MKKLIFLLVIIVLTASGCSIDKMVEETEISVFMWVARQILGITEWIASYLLNTPIYFFTLPGFQTIYSAMILIANGFILPGLIWIGIKTISGEDTLGIPDLLIRLIIATFGVNLMPWVIKEFVILCNKLSRAIVSTSTDLAYLGEILWPAGAEMALLIFLVIYLYLVVRLILIYAYRNYALIVLTAFAPIFCILWAFTNQTARVQKWANEIITLVLTQVVHALQLVLLVTLTTNAATGPPSAGSRLGYLMLQIGALLFMVRTPEWLSQYVNEGTNPVTMGKEIYDMFTMRRFRQALGLSANDVRKLKDLLGGDKK